jgi:hypothetical protein
MGQTYSVSIKKVSSLNEKKYRWVRSRRYLKKKSIPRIRPIQRYTYRSKKSLLSE